jgi:hypothetical protein
LQSSLVLSLAHPFTLQIVFDLRLKVEVQEAQTLFRDTFAVILLRFQNNALLTFNSDCNNKELLHLKSFYELQILIRYFFL